MNILQINASYKPAFIYGGPTMSVSKLSEELTAAGCNVQVYTTTANGTLELPEMSIKPAIVDGVPVYYFKRITKDHTHFSPRLLSTLWRTAQNADIIHIHAWWNLVSVLSCMIAQMRGAPVVLSPRGTLSNYSFTYKNGISKYLLHHLLGKYLLKRCTIHVTSAAEGKSIERLLKPKKSIEVFNFVTTPDKPVARIQHTGVLKLLFLSRIHPKKGLDTLINALPFIDGNWQLTIAGNGDANYIDELKKLADTNGTGDRISWIGFQSDNKFELMAGHDMLVLPSADENFANVVIESLSVGTAVVLSPAVGLADYVSNNDFGEIADPEPFALSIKINLLAANNKKLADIAANAPSIIKRDFDGIRLRERYLNMYRKIVDHV